MGSHLTHYGSMTLKTKVCLLLVAVVALGASSPAAAQFGIAAGLNFDSIDDIDSGSQNLRGTFDQASGYHAGIFYDLGAGAVGLRFGLFYRDLGDIGDKILVDDVQVPVSVDLSMIEVPVDVRFTVHSAERTAPYILLGPVISLPRTHSDDAAVNKTFDEALKTLMIAGTVGGGVVLNLGTIAVMPELRFAFGLSGLTGKKFQFGDTTFSIDETQKVRSVQLRVGLRF